MHKTIRERYNESILQEAMRRYDIRPGSIRLLDGFESFIYEFSRHDGEFILRIGHTHRNSEAFVRGEVDWINYLVENGVSAAGAVASARGNLVESIADGRDGAFLATSFVKARGRSPWSVRTSPAFKDNYGRLVGRMHALAKAYIPRDPLAARPQWDHPRIADGGTNIPLSLPVVRRHYFEYLERRRALPRDRDSFGLIHEDAHMGNMFIDENGTITLFDFDDCNYSWFVNDIAIVLFYRITGEPDPAGVTAEFLPRFLAGYALENTLDSTWLAMIPMFLKVREIELFGVLHRSFDDPEAVDDPWIKGFMTGRRERIEADMPFVDFDFGSLALLPAAG